MASNNGNKGKIKKKLKFKLNEKILPILLAGVTLVGTGIGAYKLGVRKGIKNTQDAISEENEIGHDDINPLLNFKVEDDEFVLLDVGDHDSIGTSFQDKKMRLCNDSDISLGVIISSSAKNECDIYDDVEYVKGLVRDYNIDFPIYLDIDKIMDNKKLNSDMQCKIIRDFLDKCSANKIYVGMTGTDKNLCRVREYFKITSYDAFVIMDDDIIRYTGTYNVYKDLKGNIISKTNLSEVIKNNNLNNPNNFKGDTTYIINTEEDIVDISLNCGMSVEDILQFNNIRLSSIKNGTKIRIPNKLNSETKTEDYNQGEFEVLSTPLRGCDLSHWQSASYNFEQLSYNFDYIILKSNQGTSTDQMYEEFVNNCQVYGIPVGVYCMNDYWGNLSLEEFKKCQEKQADYTLELLKNKNIEFPIYLDLEGDKVEALPNEYAEAMFEIWKTKIETAGYIAGIYCNQSDFKLLNSKVDYHLAEKFEVWIAGGPQYTGETQDIEFKDVVSADSILNDPTYKANMAQSTDSAINAGAANHNGHLDIDFCKVNYSDYKIKDNNYESSDETSEIKKFKRINKALPIALLAGGGLLIGFTGKKLIEKKKKKNKKKKKTTKK